MMQIRSTSRELALLILGQISEVESQRKFLTKIPLENLLNEAIDTLMQHWRNGLDDCAKELEIAQQEILDSELEEYEKNSSKSIRIHLKTCLQSSENILNGLSSSMELVRLLALKDQEEIRVGAIQRVSLVLKELKSIDSRLDNVMEGWRLMRLPRIDRDILRLAVVDLVDLKTPIAVTCNEAVDLANRYSDEQGRRMINGVLRRLQTSITAPSI